MTHSLHYCRSFCIPVKTHTQNKMIINSIKVYILLVNTNPLIAYILPNSQNWLGRCTPQHTENDNIGEVLGQNIFHFHTAHDRQPYSSFDSSLVLVPSKNA